MSLLSLEELDTSTVAELVRRTVAFYEDPHGHDRPLAGMVLGTLFLGTLTRTRTAFSAGAMRLGAQVMRMAPPTPNWPPVSRSPTRGGSCR